MSGPKVYHFGHETWPGLAKVMEESAELQVVLAKVVGMGGKDTYYDGRDLRGEMQDEIADLAAALQFLARANGLDAEAIDERMHRKLELFERWHREGT